MLFTHSLSLPTPYNNVLLTVMLFPEKAWDLDGTQLGTNKSKLKVTTLQEKEPKNGRKRGCFYPEGNKRIKETGEENGTENLMGAQAMEKV